jgi:hypothetical protein
MPLVTCSQKGYCKNHSVCDDSAVMILSKSGATKLMEQKLPSLIVRNSADHRLELSAGDIVNSVSIYEFKYNIMCANFLEIKPHKFVRILSTQ